MSVGSALLIVNPASRRGRTQHATALRAFRSAGVVCDAVLTERPGHASTLARELAPMYDAVFALGGDGTVMEVVGALLDQEAPVGVLPGGTGNLIARALRVPLNVRRAVGTLVKGEVRRVDLGRLSDGRVFAFAAGVGIDATMVERTSIRAKRAFGVLAYAATAARASMRLESFTLHVIVDGTPHTFRATAALVANFGSVLHGLIRLGPNVEPDDGRLDLCVFCPANMGDALRIGWRIVRKDFRPDRCMHFLRGEHFHIETDPVRPSQADGELLGPTPLDIRVVPLAARLLVPRAAPEA